MCNVWDSLVVPGLGVCLAAQGTWAQPLVGCVERLSPSPRLLEPMYVPRAQTATGEATTGRPPHTAAREETPPHTAAREVTPPPKLERSPPQLQRSPLTKTREETPHWNQRGALLPQPERALTQQRRPHATKMN